MSMFVLGGSERGGLIVYKTRSVGMTTTNFPDDVTLVVENGVKYTLTKFPGVVAWGDLNNKIHRDCGPAIEYSDGTKEWWYHGKKVECSTQEEFERYLKLKVFW